MRDGNSEVNDNMPMRDLSTTNCSICIIQSFGFLKGKRGGGERRRETCPNLCSGSVDLNQCSHSFSWPNVIREKG